MARVRRGLVGAAATLGGLLWVSGTALAQSSLPPAYQPGAQPPAAVQKAPPRPAAPAPAAKGSQEGSSGGETAQLRQRVEQLEEQLVDLQVVIGTLESLAKGGGVAPSRASISAPSSLGGSDGARLDALETQIRALTAQLEQLAEQVRSGEGRRAGAGGAAAGPFGGQRDIPGPRTGAPLAPPVSPGGGFGSTVVAPATADTGGRTAEEPASGLQAPVELASQGPDAGGNPKQAYEVAYGYLLQQNYPAAEGAFDDFLKRYPSDPLAGNAQYWLGESLFVRGQYKAAASAFLKGYQTYSKSAKAPESLLKLAMSLDRLGQKDAACSSYAELNNRFPNAPTQVKSRAQSERQRVGC